MFLYTTLINMTLLYKKNIGIPWISSDLLFFNCLGLVNDYRTKWWILPDYDKSTLGFFYVMKGPNFYGCQKYCEIIFTESALGPLWSSSCDVRTLYVSCLSPSHGIFLEASHCTLSKTIEKMALRICQPFMGLFNFPLSFTFILNS